MDKNQLVARLREMEETAIAAKTELEEYYLNRKRFDSLTERTLLRLQQLETNAVETRILVERDGVQP